MDSGWALVIGAAIALLGSTLGPRWLNNHDRKQRQLEAQRTAIQTALVDTTDALGRMFAYRFQGGTPGAFADLINATTRLALLLDAKDSQLEQLVVTTTTVVQTGEIEEAGSALSVYQTVTHKWFRGEIPGNKILDEAREEATRLLDHPVNQAAAQKRHADD